MKYALLTLLALFIFFNQNKAQMVYDVPGMSDAKFYYADKPFTNGHEGAKTNFHSGEFIYGRLELDKTLKEAFKLDNIKKGPYFLKFYVASYRGNQQQGGWNRTTAIRIEENELNNKYLNFDVLPDPEKARSFIGNVDEFGVGQFSRLRSGPMYEIFEQRFFPASDTYTIYTQLNFPALDGWGNKLPENQWPVAEGNFSFTFNEKDVATIRNNETLARQISNIVKVDKLPDYFANPVKISDQSVTVAKVTPLIKNYLNGDGYEIIKVAIEPASSMWSIVKNDIGIQSYRYVTGYYKIVYKKDGKCSLGSVRVFQDYIGNGKYGNLYCKFWGDEGDIDCSKVK